MENEAINDWVMKKALTFYEDIFWDQDPLIAWENYISKIKITSDLEASFFRISSNLMKKFYMNSQEIKEKNEELKKILHETF